MATTRPLRPAPSPIRVIVGPGHAGGRLDLALAAGLADQGVILSRKAVQRHIVAGEVRVDGRVRTHPSAEVALGSRLVWAPPEPVAGRREHRAPVDQAPPALGAERVRYEDDWLIVVDKPAGLPTHATIDPARPHLHGAVQLLLAGRVGPAGDPDGPGPAVPYLAVHHRLDVETTGLVLFAKDRSVNAALAEAFATRQVVKEYLAVCRGALPQPAWTVRNHLGRISPANRAARYGAVRHGGDPAETAFRFIRRLADGALLVEARPRTGRTHQIRVHLAGCGLPIVGDRLYSGAVGPRVLLHAWRLRLPHPVTGATLAVDSEIPADLIADGR